MAFACRGAIRDAIVTKIDKCRKKDEVNHRESHQDLPELHEIASEPQIELVANQSPRKQPVLSRINTGNSPSSPRINTAGASIMEL